MPQARSVLDAVSPRPASVMTTGGVKSLTVFALRRSGPPLAWTRRTLCRLRRPDGVSDVVAANRMTKILSVVSDDEDRYGHLTQLDFLWVVVWLRPAGAGLVPRGPTVRRAAPRACLSQACPSAWTRVAAPGAGGASATLWFCLRA